MWSATLCSGPVMILRVWTLGSAVDSANMPRCVSRGVALSRGGPYSTWPRRTTPGQCGRCTCCSTRWWHPCCCCPCCLVCLKCASYTALYWQWRRILPLLPDATRERVERWLAGSARFVYRPLSALDWRTALDEGISSSLFDIEANIRDGDSRAGLDEDGLQEVHRLMQEHHLVRTYACLPLLVV